MYSKRKLFIFHNKKVVTHIESQPNQSKFIEDLILNNLNPIPQPDIISFLQQYLKPQTPEQNFNQDISSSISNILNL